MWWSRDLTKLSRKEFVMTEKPLLAPLPLVETMDIYRPGFPADPNMLRLDANEGMAPPRALLEQLVSESTEVLRRYPSGADLERTLAARFGLEPEQLLVTAGGDDGLYRAFRAMLDASREVILTLPSYEMLDRYAKLTGAKTHVVPWLEGDYPVSSVLPLINERTRLISVVSPNNPTGGVISIAGLETLSKAAPHALIVADLAYTEFADVDLSTACLRLPNVVAVRTFSKAWGLAGLRVGYAMGPKSIINWMRAVGGPYSVSRLSLQLMMWRLEQGQEAVHAYVERVRQERESLYTLLRELGTEPVPSQANFVLTRTANAQELHTKLLEEGISVRYFRGRPALQNYVRITCPGNTLDYQRLESALRNVLAPSIEDVANEGQSQAPLRSSAGSLAPLRNAEIIKDNALLRGAEFMRVTKETQIAVRLKLDGEGRSEVQTGIGFLDHMLSTLAKHSRMDVTLRCQGDLEIDDHHTSEDCALALGAALDQALAERKGIARFGYAYAPLDEALARAVVDFSGRPYATINLGLTRPTLGGWATENITHFLMSLATAARATLQVEVLRGFNDHHRVEAAFKATALALRQAIATDGGQQVPSTKGVL